MKALSYVELGILVRADPESSLTGPRLFFMAVCDADEAETGSVWDV